MVSEETFTLDEEEVRKLSPRSSKVGETMEVDTEYSNEQREATARKNCCWALWDYDGICEARGYALLALGRGVAVMSNVLVNAALLELAMDAAGCPTRDELDEMETNGTIEDADDFECTNTIYGMDPLSLISNIAVVTGLLSAFFMPLIGVVLDFTPYRKFVGILFTSIFAVIQGIQIGIGPRTWFAMAILQSIAGFCFTVNIMTALAYLPEICEKVGQQKHSTFTARFTAKQFSMQAFFLILVGALSLGIGIANDSVKTARLSQGMNVFFNIVFFGVGWKYMPTRPASRPVPEGERGCAVLIHGIRQNLQTSITIFTRYKKGLRFYLLATMFVQSSVGALTTLSVVYLTSEVGLTASAISFFFLVVLVGTVPGSRIASMISKRTNPNTSWQMSMLYLFGTVVTGALTVGDAPNKYLSLIWGFFVGMGLGWFYPTENLFFSCILPKGQEAEIAGFRVIFSAILSWFPPLMFSILIQNGVDPKWGMALMGSFTLISAFILKLGTGKWDEILAESQRSELSDHQA